MLQAALNRRANRAHVNRYELARLLQNPTRHRRRLGKIIAAVAVLADPDDDDNNRSDIWMHLMRVVRRGKVRPDPSALQYLLSCAARKIAYEKRKDSQWKSRHALMS